MGLTWHAAVSADIGNHEDILDMMADAGCKSLFIGFETVNQKNLKCCHKTQNRIERYDDTISKIHKRGMMVNASVVLGFDGDDVSVFRTTLDWLVKNKVASMTAHILTPYPGTQLYHQMEKEKRLIDLNLDHYNTANVVYIPEQMTAEELEKGYLWTYSEFYSWKSILSRLPEEKAQWLAYLQFNILYRKYGKVTSVLGNLIGMRHLADFATNVAYPHRKKKSCSGHEHKGYYSYA